MLTSATYLAAKSYLVLYFLWSRLQIWIFLVCVGSDTYNTQSRVIPKFWHVRCAYHSTIRGFDTIPEQRWALNHRDSIWYPASAQMVSGDALEALRLNQCTGSNDLRVAKLLAPGTVLSSTRDVRHDLLPTHAARAGRNHTITYTLIHGKGPNSSSLYSESRRKPTHWHGYVGVLNRIERFTKTGICIKTYRCPFEQL